MKVLEKALMMSYVNSRMTIKNLEVALHEMRVVHNLELGKLQFYTERLIKANKDMYAMLEKNLGKNVIDDIEKDIESLLDKCWD
jgi:hypothetical protein